MDEIQIEEPQLSEQDIVAQQAVLAARVGKDLTIAQAYERLDRGELRGTILESKLSMLRFLLGAESLPEAAE